MPPPPTGFFPSQEVFTPMTAALLAAAAAEQEQLSRRVAPDKDHSSIGNGSSQIVHSMMAQPVQSNRDSVNFSSQNTLPNAFKSQYFSGDMCTLTQTQDSLVFTNTGDVNPRSSSPSITDPMNKDAHLPIKARKRKVTAVAQSDGTSFVYAIIDIRAIL